MVFTILIFPTLFLVSFQESEDEIGELQEGRRKSEAELWAQLVRAKQRNRDCKLITRLMTHELEEFKAIVAVDANV